MKEVEIKLKYSKKEFKTIMEALNNATVALNTVYARGRLGCEVPKEFEKFFDRPFDEVDKLCNKRMDTLVKFYYNLKSYEE